MAGGDGPTSLDVARRIGVSQSTVSLVLSGKAAGRVSEELQTRVRLVAGEMGYHPHAAARSLRLGRTQTLALVVPDVTNPFFVAVLRGAQAEARRRGYAVLLVDTEDDAGWWYELVQALQGRALDGFMLCAVPPPDRDMLARLGPRTILMEGWAPDIPSVQVDAAGGTRAAMAYLLGLGHRRIGHLAATPNHETYRHRAREYRAALAGAGITRSPGWEAPCGVSVDEGRRAAGLLLDLAEPPTALFCDDDLMAAGAYKAARDRGLRIPRDLSVVGFDDIELARVLEPELTTVALPAVRMGAIAVELLVSRLEGGEDIAALQMPVGLVIRGSTAPAP